MYTFLTVSSVLIAICNLRLGVRPVGPSAHGVGHGLFLKVDQRVRLAMEEKSKFRNQERSAYALQPLEDRLLSERPTEKGPRFERGNSSQESGVPTARVITPGGHPGNKSPSTCTAYFNSCSDGSIRHVSSRASNAQHCLHAARGVGEECFEADAEETGDKSRGLRRDCGQG